MPVIEAPLKVGSDLVSVDVDDGRPQLTLGLEFPSPRFPCPDCCYQHRHVPTGRNHLGQVSQFLLDGPEFARDVLRRHGRVRDPGHLGHAELVDTGRVGRRRLGTLTRLSGATKLVDSFQEPADAVTRVRLRRHPPDIVMLFNVLFGSHQ